MDNEFNHNIFTLSGNKPTTRRSSCLPCKYKGWNSNLFIVAITLTFQGNQTLTKVLEFNHAIM